MNEIFKDAFYISGTICFITLTAAAIKTMSVLKALWTGPGPADAVVIDPVPTDGVEQNDSVFDVPAVEFSEANGSLECGQCHQEIMTAPVSVEGKPPYEKVLYKCEHCGTDVAIPA